VVVIADKNGLVWIDDLTGGLNDTDPPQDIAANQCTIAQNVEWVTTRFAQRRQGGSNPIGTEIWAAGSSLVSLMRHTPTADEGAAELWAVNNESPSLLGRLAAGNNWASVSVNDGWTQTNFNYQYINGVSLNGKFFIAGDTAVDRLHVWDGTSLRRVGLPAPVAAPTVANQGAGTYAATLRYYKVHFTNTNTGQVSELSAAVSFTPSGAGLAARVTRPTLPGEGENFWRLFGSPDGVNYYNINFAAAATTFIDDTIAPSAYATQFPTFAGFPTDADYFTAPPSPKYLLADEDRLILLSSWETASAASAVMWTPVLGTTPAAYGVSDDERVPSTNRLDLDRGDGGGITGGGILAGTVYVFKLSHIYQLDRTGNVDLPYRAIPLTKKLGAISHKSIVEGEDDAGAPCLYFLSRRGPYRLSQHGLEYLGRDIEATWDTVNINASAATVPFGVWHQEKRQVQWWVTTGAATSPDKKLVLHARHAHRAGNGGEVRGGWAIHTEGAADAYCAVMFANTLGVTMSLDLKPYVGQRWVTSLPDGPCIKYDADGTDTDRGANATTYIGRVKPGAFAPGGPGMKGRVTQAYVLGTPANRALMLDVIADFGATTRSGSVPLPSASASETRELVKVDDDARAADAMYVEIVLDDDVTPASSAAWTVDAIGLRVGTEGQI
jgi:hypothetical protein